MATDLFLPPTANNTTGQGYKESVDIFFIHDGTVSKKLTNWHSVLLMEGFSSFLMESTDPNVPSHIKLIIGELTNETMPMCFISGFGNTSYYKLFTHDLDYFVETILPKVERLTKQGDLSSVSGRVYLGGVKKHEKHTIQESSKAVNDQDDVNSTADINYIKANVNNDVRVNVKAMVKPPMIPAWFATVEVLKALCPTFDNLSLHAILSKCEETGRFESCVVIAEELRNRGVLSDYSKYPNSILKIVKYASRVVSPEEEAKLMVDVAKILKDE